MEFLHTIVPQEIIAKIGWILIHFIWQAAVVGIFLAIFLRFLRKSSANLRYLTGCMALLMVILMPIVTFCVVDTHIESYEPIEISAEVVAIDMVMQTLSEISVIGSSDLMELPELSESSVLPAPPQNFQPTETAAHPKLPLKDRITQIIEPNFPYIVITWLIGVLGLSLWYLGGWVQLQKLRRQMHKPVPTAIETVSQRIAAVLGIKKGLPSE